MLTSHRVTASIASGISVGRAARLERLAVSISIFCGIAPPTNIIGFGSAQPRTAGDRD